MFGFGQGYFGQYSTGGSTPIIVRFGRFVVTTLRASVVYRTLAASFTLGREE